MDKPTLTDYVKVICTLFTEFVQVEPEYESKRYTNGTCSAKLTWVATLRTIYEQAQFTGTTEQT